MEFIKAALGHIQADLVLKNALYVDVFSLKIARGDIAISGDKIVGIGSYNGVEEIDCSSYVVVPGFIDGHVHIESSMMSPSQYAAAVVPQGTTTVIADPHEIVNVSGLKGLEFMMEDAKKSPLDVFFMLPSCVPATPFEVSGSVLNASDYEDWISHPQILGMGEMMNYKGVIHEDAQVLEKIKLGSSKLIDGHAPLLKDKELQAYIGAGIHTDHECTTVEEVQQRIASGMYVQIRQGSAARDLSKLVSAINIQNYKRALFCSDDCHLEQLMTEGHINNNIRLAVKNGLDPLLAISMASLNAAECYGLKKRGGIAPGWMADLVVLNNLSEMQSVYVFKQGEKVAQNGKALFSPSLPQTNLQNTIHLNPISEEQVQLPFAKEYNVIQMIPGSLFTKKKIVNNTQGLLKLAVFERYQRSGEYGLAYAEGLPLKNAAIASSVSHDSHNVIVLGDNDADMVKAVNYLINIQGGYVVVSQGNILANLPLPISGLLSTQNVDEVLEKMKLLLQASEKIGIPKSIDPFLTLSFMALPVIPELKLSVQGLFDVTEWKFI